MFSNLPTPPTDAIIGLIKQFREDPRPHKMDLSVGVYADQKGETIILDAVKKAEQRLLDTQKTKTYVGMAGDLEFNQTMHEIVFGENFPTTRIRGVQATGGSGSLRILAEMIGRNRPQSRVWLSTPTWPNHKALLNVAGMPINYYPYFDDPSKQVDFHAMKAALSSLSSDDIVVLHGCCHNPTGANLSQGQWDEVAELAKERGFFPFVDMAYQGFGDNLDDDAYGPRKLAQSVEEMAVAVSCSKNFGIYRERTGCAFVMGKDEADTLTAYAQLQTVSRSIYSMPPDHGAAIVKLIWNDPALRQQWLGELTAINSRMRHLRETLAGRLREATGTPQFDFLTTHKGMFSRLGLTPEQVDKLRNEHAIYLVGDSRMNIAGLQEKRIDTLIQAIMNVI